MLWPVFYINILNGFAKSGTMDYLQRVLDGLKVFTGTGSETQEPLQEKEKPEQLLDEVTFEGIANYIKNGHCECNNSNNQQWFS